jgi:hypothetical protein
LTYALSKYNIRYNIIVISKINKNPEVFIVADLKADYKVLLPKLPKELDKLDFLDNIEDESIFSEGVVCDCSIEDQLAEHVTFKQMVFRNVLFKNVSFKFLV